MTNALATQLAHHLTGVLVHPGDETTKPFPLAPFPQFQTAQMPPGMAEDLAERAGLPSTDFARIWLEAIIHLIETEGGVELVDKAELADLREAAAEREHKRNQMLEFHTPCGATVRAMARGFDTTKAEVPCALVVHQCGGR